MFLFRIKKWKQCKNVKSSEKEHIIKADADYDQYAFNYRAVRQDNLLRYLRQKQHTQDSSQDQTDGQNQRHSSTSMAVRKHRDQMRAMGELRKQKGMPTRPAVLRDSLQLGNEQSLLLLTKQYFDWYFNIVAGSTMSLEEIYQYGLPMNDKALKLESTVSMDEAITDILYGLEQLSDGYRTDPWSLIHKSCEQISRSMLRQSSFTLMNIMKYVKKSISVKLPALTLELQSHMVSIARATFGQSHVFSQLLSVTFSMSTNSLARCSATKFAMGTLYTSSLKADLLFMHNYLLALGNDIDDQDYVGSRLLTAVNDLTVSSEQNLFLLRTAKARLAVHLLRTNRKDSLGLEMLRDLEEMSLTLDFQPKGTIYEVYAYLSYMATAYAFLQDHAKCVTILMQLLRLDTIHYSIDHYVLEVFSCIQQSLIYLENWDELRKLRLDYPKLQECMPDYLYYFEIPDLETMVDLSEEGLVPEDESLEVGTAEDRDQNKDPVNEINDSGDSNKVLPGGNEDMTVEQFWEDFSNIDAAIYKPTSLGMEERSESMTALQDWAEDMNWNSLDDPQIMWV